MAQIVSDLENNHTGRKVPTMAIRFGFLIENFSYNCCLKVLIGSPTQILIFFVGHAHTELRAPVM